MEYLKKLFRNYWVLSIFCIVLGIALIIKPGFFTDAICYVIGGLFAAFGAADLIRYFAKDRADAAYSSGLVRGIIFAGGHAGHQEKRRHRDGAARTRTGGRDGGLRRVPCGMHAAGKPGMTARESEPAAYRRKAYRARGGGGGRGMPVR